MTLKQEVEHTRHPAYKINPLFINRWSPRSMSGEELNDEDSNSVEAAASSNAKGISKRNGKATSTAAASGNLFI